MRFIAVVFLVAFASVMHAEDAKPLVAKELAEFLGPESPQAFRWTKNTMIDFDLYNGEAIHLYPATSAFTWAVTHKNSGVNPEAPP